MTWNSNQIRACRERVANGQHAMIDEACGAPFDVLVNYGAWDGTSGSLGVLALDNSLAGWLKRVLAEEEKLAGTPAPLPNGATVTRHTITELRRGDGSLLARHDGSAPDDVLMVFGEKGHTLTVQIETLEQVVAMARKAQAEVVA